MADDGTFIKSVDIQARCGVNANATTKAAATGTDFYVKDVEHWISTMVNYDCITNYGTMTANAKLILKDIGACICAMYVINSDMSGFTSRLEAQTMLDFLQYRAMKGLDLLNQPDCRTFLGMV